MPKKKERKRKALRKVVELAKKGTPFNVKRISGEALQGMAASGKAGLARQAKLELRRRQEKHGSLQPGKKLNTMVSGMFGKKKKKKKK